MRFVPLAWVVCLFVIPSALAQTTADLMQMLKSPKANVRRFAADSLGKQKATTAIPALSELLKDSAPEVREAAGGALGQMGKGALLALMDALKYPVEDTRVAGLKGLRMMGPDAQLAMPAITTALKDKSIDVRIHAASALGSLKAQGKTALPALFMAAKDMGNLPGVIRPDLPSSVTEAAIAAALDIDEKCGPSLAKAVLPTLIGALQRKDEPTVQAAGNGLARLGPHAKAALPALENAYKRATGFTESTLGRAIVAVGSDGIGVLGSIVGDDKAPLQKRLMALSDLGGMNNPDDKVVSILAATLKDPEPQMRAGAAMALAMVGPKAKGAIGGLVELLADAKLDAAADKVRSGSSKVVPEALTRIGSESVPALIDLLKDESKSPFARWQAAGTLSNLGRKAKPALGALEAALKQAVTAPSPCRF
jgi:HEAT repeat protein